MTIPDKVMGVYDRKVISVIGRDIWNHIRDHVDSGTLNSQQMCDIARLLSPKVGGNHSRRVKDERKSSVTTMMRKCTPWTHKQLFRNS